MTRSESKRMAEEIEDLRRRLEAVSKERDEIKAEIGELISREEELKSQIYNAEDTQRKLEQELKEAITAFEDLDLQRTVDEEEIDQLKKALYDLERSVELLVLRAEKAIREENSETIRLLTQENRHLREKLSTSTEEVETVRSEVIHLKHRLEESLSHRSQGSKETEKGTSAHQAQSSSSSSQSQADLTPDMSQVQAFQPSPSGTRDTSTTGDSTESVDRLNSPAWASAAMAAFHLPSLESYRGDKANEEDSARIFVNAFERHATLAGWTGEVKRLQFEVRLKGRALQMYESVPIAARRSYDSAKAAWLQLMQPVRLREYQQASFHERSQYQSESVADYARVKQSMFDKGYGECPIDATTKDSLLKGAFKRGLLDHIKKRLPSTAESYQDLLLQARQIEAEDRADSKREETSSRRPHRSSQSRASSSASPVREENSSSTTMKESRESEAKTSNSTKRFHPKMRCFRCMAKADHYASDCPVSEANLPQVRASNTTTMKKGKGRVEAVQIEEPNEAS